MPPPLPFPVAFPYHLIKTGRSPAVRYERLLQCYEALVRYVAAVQLSDYLAAGCPDAALNRKLLGRLGRSLALGHWLELIRDVARLQKQGAFAPFMPELVSFTFGGRGTGPSPEVVAFETTLVAARNDWAHRDQTWSEAAFAQKLKDQKAALLDPLLDALGFLGRYPLYVPYRGPRPEVVTEAFVLMGPTVPPELREDLDLHLAPRVREHLEYEMTAFLADPDDPGRQLLLYPLSLFANRDGAEDLFLFDGCDLRREMVRRLFYRASRVEQAALEVRPGSEHERVVRHFRDVLRALGGGRPAEAEPPPGEDLAAHYFAVQREILEEHTRHFVGRVAARQALERFLAGRRRGYFLVRGGPGQGKTAFACHLVRERRAVHHFVSRTGGRADVRLILRSLLAQLLPLAGAPAALPEAVPELTKRLEDVLARLAARGEAPLLVIDGLDELPAEAGPEQPFLVTEGLPEGVHVVITSRPGDRLDRLVEGLFAVPHEVHDLGPLEPAEVGEILRGARPDLSAGDVERIAAAAQGNPLYLRAVVEELGRHPGFDLRDLPASIEGFFRRATAGLRGGGSPALHDVLGLLAAARKPLTLRELSQITGLRQRPVYEEGVRPVRPFLLEVNDGYAFYHARFHDFVVRELLYEDERRDAHRKLADWLAGPDGRGLDYAWSSLAYHLFEAGERERLLATVDLAYLAEKARRAGYAVLEDVELVTRTLLEAGDPALLERCVALVEGLRGLLGGDLIESPRAPGTGPAAPASWQFRLFEPAVPSVPGVDLYVGMIPQGEVGADFFEVMPRGDRVVVAVGDAPGVGVKGAFVAQFIGNVLRGLAERPDRPDLGEVLGRLNESISSHAYFQRVSLQCLEIDPRAGVVTAVNAGHPYPVLFSARRGRWDLLPVRGEVLNAQLPGVAPPRYEPRRAEIDRGDVLVLVTDGLLEGHRLDGDAYGYRFTRLLRDRAGQGARALGQAILEDWRAHPKKGRYVDDVTVLVVGVTGKTVSSERPEGKP